MRLSRSRSLLLVVDVQSRLLPAIAQGEDCLAQVQWLMQVAEKLQVPVLATEHCPEHLGVSHDTLRGLLPESAILPKRHFSAVPDGLLAFHPESQREQWVVTGTEAHVCVLQTVLGLLAAGRHVYVVAEAVGSRRDADRQLALERMRQAGAIVVSREMVAFEWLESADAPEFRTVLREFLR